MKKIILIIFFLSIFLKFNLIEIYGQDFTKNDYLNDTIDSLSLESYDYKINKNIVDGMKLDYSFSKIVKKAINGELKDINLFNIIKYMLNALFNEIFINSKIIKNVIIIAILCAFLKALTDSFKNKGVGEIGFYAGYMVIATLLINSFNLGIGIVVETINSISNIINSLIPLLAGVLVISGASASGAIFTGVIVTFINLVMFIINQLFIPLVSSMVILNIINYITPKEVLNKLIDFFKWMATFGIRALAIAFAFIISFQKVTSPMVNSAINKTAKTAVSFIPIVGDVINGTIDGVMHFMGLVKGSVGVGVVIIILIACSVPILKLISFIIIYKITAILIEPISDKRITACIDCIGEYTKMILSTLFIFVFLFILVVSVMLSISG